MDRVAYKNDRENYKQYCNICCGKINIHADCSTGIIRRLFTWLIVLYPVLQVYFVPIGNIRLSFADTLMLVLLPFLIFLLFLSPRIQIEKTTMILLFYCILHFGVMKYLTLIANPSISDTGHFILVLFILAFLCLNFMDKERTLNLLMKVSFISSAFLLLQFVLIHGAGVYLPGQLPFLESSTAVTGHIRPFSLFSEPAAFGWYNNIGLATILFTDQLSKRRKRLYTLVISLALFLSTSTTSICLMACVWLIWIMQKKGMAKRIKWVLVIALALMPVIVLAELKYGIIETIYLHSFVGLTSGNYAGGVMHRFVGYEEALSYNKDKFMFYKLFGNGIIEINGTNFVPTIGRITIFYGFSGYFIFAGYFVKMFFKSELYGKVLIVIAALSAIFAESLFGLMMLWYMPYVILNCNVGKNK